MDIYRVSQEGRITEIKSHETIRIVRFGQVLVASEGTQIFPNDLILLPSNSQVVLSHPGQLPMSVENDYQGAVHEVPTTPTPVQEAAKPAEKLVLTEQTPREAETTEKPEASPKESITFTNPEAAEETAKPSTTTPTEQAGVNVIFSLEAQPEAAPFELKKPEYNIIDDLRQQFINIATIKLAALEKTLPPQAQGPINDPPTLFAIPSNPIFTEDGAAQGLFMGAVINTIEVGQRIEEIRFEVSGLTDGSSEQIIVDGATFNLTDGIAGNTGPGGVNVSISVTGDTATVSITRNGNISVSDAQTLINELQYQNVSQNPTSGNRVATLTYLQDSGGTNNGGVDAGDFNIASTIGVLAINDAPLLSPSSPELTQITEDNATNSGDTVSSLLSGSVTDVDSASFGMAIYATDTGSGNGTWQYRLEGGNWTNIDTVDLTSALLLSEADSIRFVPDTLSGTTASFSFYAWDQSSGTVGNKVDVSVRGDTTAFSTADDTATIHVSEVADTFTLTAGVDTVVGGSLNDTIITTVANYNAGDSISGGGGTDTLELTGGGAFTLTNNLSGVELVNLLDNGSYTINLTSAADITNIDGSALTGSNAVNVNAQTYTSPLTISGGAGDDSLMGGTGADTLLGGAGDDTLFYDSSDTSIDGGDNTQTLGLGDVLKLVSSDQNLDLTSISNNVIQGIEIIDTTGSGTNELTLDINDVLDISSSTNNLFIQGDVTDTLNLVNTGGNTWGLIGGGVPQLVNGELYVVVTNSDATVYVDTNLGLNIL